MAILTPKALSKLHIIRRGTIIDCRFPTEHAFVPPLGAIGPGDFRLRRGFGVTRRRGKRQRRGRRRIPIEDGLSDPSSVPNAFGTTEGRARAVLICRHTPQRF